MYMNRFFKTKDEAVAFQKEQGFGALYSNAKGSRTKSSYQTEALMMGKSNEFQQEHPFCVAWNHHE